MAKLHLDYVNSFYDSRGKLRHVFRRKGHKRVSLPGKPGDAVFIKRYDELKKLTDPDAETVDRDAPGSVDRVIKEYFQDEGFIEGLAKATQGMRRAILNRFRNSVTPGGRRFGDNQIVTLQTAIGRERLSDEVTKQSTPAARKNYLKALRGLMVYAMGVKGLGLASDPTEGIKVKPPQKSMGHLTWHDEQVEQYRERHKLGTTARLALELALNVAARRHDCHVLGRQHLKNGRLVWTPHKTKRITGKKLSIKASAEFLAALKAMPASDSMAFLTTDYDRPFKSSAALGNKMADWCRAAGLKPVTCEDGKVRSYRLHGLRKCALTKLAHDGATGPELLAVSGQSSLSQVEPYIQEANQARLVDSAMEKRADKEKKLKVE